MSTSAVVRENIGTLTDKLTVKVSKEEYLPLFEKKLKEYSKTANIPGFRKGMVPAGMIKKMYYKPVLIEEINKRRKTKEEAMNNTLWGTDSAGAFDQIRAPDVVLDGVHSKLQKPGPLWGYSPRPD